jgi:hypothetical protein
MYEEVKLAASIDSFALLTRPGGRHPSFVQSL